MSIFRCLLCGGEFGVRSSHYCDDDVFVLVTPEKNQALFVEMIDWTWELITNNGYLKNN